MNLDSVLKGGQFRDGAIAYAAAGGAAGKNTTARIVTAAFTGGSVSVATGGKFANGAATGAFSAAVSAIGQAQYRKDMQEFYDSLGLDSSGDSGTAKGGRQKR